eukprot:Protomagalhaensia_sp_Gyna_25__5654@NODE_799_length_2598_cov_229_554123_g629_i0_p1_GENE_NODE_799_length_2598_cov_229_554123_g629_i0NODE_799_length_2598_cov_229_554123_g629_i0_p1_ORF_typecomplete_len517_score104_88_NODE_799_length_2598_cov_229_554123_g629_i0181568
MAGDSTSGSGTEFSYEAAMRSPYRRTMHSTLRNADLPLERTGTQTTSTQTSVSTGGDLIEYAKKSGNRRLYHFQPAGLDTIETTRAVRRKARPQSQEELIHNLSTSLMPHQYDEIEIPNKLSSIPSSHERSTSSSSQSSTSSSGPLGRTNALGYAERKPELMPRSKAPLGYHQPEIDDEGESTPVPQRRSIRLSREDEDSSSGQRYLQVTGSFTASSAAPISWEPVRSSGGVPPLYIQAADLESVPVGSLESLFLPEGFQIARCFAALRYRKDVIEEFRCKLTVHRDEPVFRFDNLTENKSRLLLPDLQVGPTVSPTALDAFAYYSWPRGDRQLQDMKHICGVMCTFRNLREPIYFATPDTDQQRLFDCFATVRRAAIMLDTRRRETFGDKNRQWEKHTAPPSPSRLFKSERNPADLEPPFAAALNLCSKKLATVKAVEKYWTRECEVFTIYWIEKRAGRGKYKTAIMQTYINPYKPDIVVADKKGTALSDILDLTTLSCSRHRIGNSDELPSCIV